jgi:hypothetical protein
MPSACWVAIGWRPKVGRRVASYNWIAQQGGLGVAFFICANPKLATRTMVE